jgi:hypothetical protein
MEKKDFGGLRRLPCIIFVAAIWVGCRMYHVCGNENVESWDFHTKKEAEKFIREKFTGNEMKIRLYDLKNCPVMYNPRRVVKS